MNAEWVVVVALAVGVAALRLAGPLVLAGRELPRAVASVTELLGPALLAGLVAIQLVAPAGSLRLDESAVGVGLGGLALSRGVPLLAAVVLASAATALLRFLS